MRFKAKDENTEHFVRKVEISFSSVEDSILLDSQSRIANKMQNLLKEEIEKDLWLLKNGNYYGVLNERLEKEILYSIYNQIGLRNRVPELKNKHPYFKTVHSSVLKNIALKVYDAIQKHQKGQGGWIKFQSWKKRWTRNI